jgi:exonuclease SbcC
MEQFKAELRVSRGVMKGISELSSCPTCRQRVTDEHKKGIIKTEQEKTKILDGKIEFLQGEEQQLLQEIQSLKLSLEVLQKKQSSYAVLRVKLQNLCEKKEQHEKNLGEISFLSLQIDSLDVSIFEISRKIQQMEQADIVEYNKIKQQISRFEQDLKTLELQKSSLQATLRAVDGEISLLEREIDKKTQSRIKLEYLSSLLYWMEINFLPLTEAMEKRVMEKINLDFSELFRKWFTLLMDSEAIQSSLDREFTPIITQNNYEIDYAHLSGGEKTAAALAYRLSLNHVINNLMSDIKTNDLLILDEPTDGFSEQQLERIRDVLEELQVAQVIIVSHESKIESFVEHILRVEKENHVSKVLLVG